MKRTIHFILLVCLAVLTPLLSICQKNNGNKVSTQNQADSTDGEKGTDQKNPNPCKEPRTEFILEFNGDGQLISNPPEKLMQGSILSVRVNLDESFWNKRTRLVLDHYLETLANVRELREGIQNGDIEVTYGITTTDLDAVLLELRSRIYHGIKGSSLTVDLQNFYLKRAGISKDPGMIPVKYIPSFADLGNPVYMEHYRFYNRDGNRINNEGRLFCVPEVTPSELKPCCGKKSNLIGGYHRSEKPAVIPSNTFETQYELRLKDSFNEAAVKWSAGDFPEDLTNLLPTIEKTLTKKFFADFTGVEKEFAVLKEDAVAADTDPVQKKIDVLNTILAPLIKDLNDISTGTRQAKRDWILRWLWLTKGVPQINPFVYQRKKLFPDEKKENLSDTDRSRYHIFDNMVNKNAIQLDDMAGFKTELEDLPQIKAAIDQEAKTKSPPEGPFSDAFLHKGLLRISAPTGKSSYMRHHDVARDYLVMGTNPIREINEAQRLFILIVNRVKDDKLGISITAAAVTDEGSAVMRELNTYADVASSGTPYGKLLASIKKLKTTVDIFTGLSKPPVPPLFFEEDPTPSYKTEVLEHNYFFDAPAMINYSIKSVVDNTQNEIKQSSYRVNKLYRLRFKAGLVYSFLEMGDYTETGPNQYTLQSTAAGIDGTFGVQAYFKKHDIRHPRLNTGYGYVGLSMKNIKENFYAGVGFEPYSGLAIGAVAHFGLRESLTESQGIPWNVKETWATGIGFSVLVDWVLFTKLFGFGSTNKTMVGL